MPQAGSVDARSPVPGSPAQDTAAVLPPHWWAAGLTLAERLRLSGQPARPAQDERLERARRRLGRWRESPGLGKDGYFARLLDERGLDTDRLLALLAEDPRDLADRAAPTTGRPAWAETVEAVLRAMPAESAMRPEEIPPSDEESAWQLGFMKIVSPFLRVAVGRLVAAVHDDGMDDLVDVHHLSHQLATQLGQQLTTLAGRTLVLELNVMRVTDRLRGETARERFWSFVEHYSTRDALAGLMSEYVVLARLLAQACDQAVEAYHELLVRLAEDRAEIVTSVLGGEDPGRLVEVHMGGTGDLHQGGRSVGLLRFADGARLVYKPRPLAVHRHVNDVIRWLDERLPGYGLRSLVVVDRGRYGWVEFVEHSPCENVDGARLFYRRQGALLALLYALDGADFHYENLIANGDQPVLVDLEAVFHPRVPRPSGLDWMNGDPAVSVLTESVSRIGLLPSVLWGEDGDAIDMGGVGGDAGQPLPFKVVGWGGSGTDEMHLTRENILFPGSQNRPSVDGHVVNPAHFVSELISGFRDGYEAIVAHRSELVGPGGLLERFADDEIRVVMRATRLYGTLLLESTHPDVLRDALDRERVFDFLWGFAADDPIRRPLVPVESEELWSGDIPMFTTRPATRDLWNGRGVRMPGVLDHDSLTHAMDKVRAMGARDRAQQEWIIEASMATRPDQAALVGAGPVPVPVEPAVPPSPVALDHERVLAAVRGIADQVAAIAHADGSRVNWLGIDLIQESQWMVNPLRLDLYSGIPGVALFLAQAASVLGDDRYADLARRALTPLPEIVDSVVNAPAGTPMTTCGPFSGYGGLAYALTHLTRELGDPSLGDAIEPLVTSLTESIPIDEMFDVIGGSAGALCALLAVHEATGLPVALRLARACADRLVETARPQRRGVAWPGAISSSLPLTGFSHGGAGIGWALSRFAATPDGATAGARYAETARAAFAYERDLYDPRVRNWPDYRDIPGERADDTAPASMQAWCHGAPGIGLARADLLRRGVADGLAADAQALTADLDLALASFLASPAALGGHSLCHGELGNLELVTTMIAAGRTDLVEARDRRLGVVLDQLESGPRCGTPAGVPTPGLMSGLAGIGHGLLRHAFPDRVPSVLLLEPPIG